MQKVEILNPLYFLQLCSFGRGGGNCDRGEGEEEEFTFII